MRYAVAVLAVFLIGASAFAQEVKKDAAPEATPVKEHNFLLGMNFAEGFYARELQVKSTSTDLSGIAFSGGSFRTDLSLGYGYYGLDPLRFNVRGTFGYDGEILRWKGLDQTQFESDLKSKRTVGFYQGEHGAFGLEGDVEYNLSDVVFEAAAGWRGSSETSKDKNTHAVDRMSYELLEFTGTVGYQVASWLKPYVGLRYTDFGMHFTTNGSHKVFIPPVGPVVDVQDHFDIRLGFKRNLSYVGGIDFGGAGAFSFHLEGWFGDVYGGTLGMEFRF